MPAIHAMMAITCSALIHSYITKISPARNQHALIQKMPERLYRDSVIKFGCRSEAQTYPQASLF
jgi:hypothetical protein